MSTEEYNENDEFEPKDESVDPDYAEEEEKPRKGSRIVLIIAVLALVGLNVFLGVSIYKQTEDLKLKEAEIANITIERDKLLARVDSLSTSLESLNRDLTGKDSSILALLSEVETLKSDLLASQKRVGSVIALEQKVRDFDKLKSLADEREKEINALKDQLKEERKKSEMAKSANDTLTQRLNEIEQEKANLENKVNLGAKLMGSIKELTSFSEKRGKLRETDKADQVSKLLVKYTVAANPIAKKETKTAYIIVKQGSKVFTQPGFTFELKEGKTLEYTHKDELKYNGQETSNSPTLNLPEDLSGGTYTVEIYIDNVLFGSQNIILR